MQFRNDKVTFRDICVSLTACYAENDSKLIKNQDNIIITTTDGSQVFQWFLDGEDVTFVPSKRSLSDTRVLNGPILRLTESSKYVYIANYTDTDDQHKTHYITVCWMGFEHPTLGIIYKSVEWDSVKAEFPNQRIADGYDTMANVFCANPSPVWLSQMFWGLMQANSSRKHVNEQAVSVKTFRKALGGKVQWEALQALTAIASGVTSTPNTTDTKSATCYRFTVEQGRIFEWRWAVTGQAMLSFGYT